MPAAVLPAWHCAIAAAAVSSTCEVRRLRRRGAQCRAVLGVGHAGASGRHLARRGDVDTAVAPLVHVVGGLDRQTGFALAAAGDGAPPGTPALTRAFLTASARRCDSATLKSGEPTVSVWPVSVTVALPALLQLAATCWIVAINSCDRVALTSLAKYTVAGGIGLGAIAR